jgi:hypothetical protein
MEGIEWSVSVTITRDSKGDLCAKVPPQVAERLKVGKGDVLCWTAFEGGSIEVWSVQKSPYGSLEGGED